MTKEVKALVDQEGRKSKVSAERQQLERELKELRAEESSVRDATDMRMSA